MKRHYFISRSVDDLESVEIALEGAGFSPEQIHVISNDEAALHNRHLHVVNSIFKRDVLRYVGLGFALGLAGATLVVLGSSWLGISEKVSAAPAFFLAAALLGFCTWEGGLWGIQKPNRSYARFQAQLREGWHLMIVDARQDQWHLLAHVVALHEAVEDAGVGDEVPDWWVGLKHQIHQLFGWSPEVTTK